MGDNTNIGAPPPPQKPPTRLVMDMGQPDAVIAAQLGLRPALLRPRPQRVHSVEHHTGLVGVDATGCRRIRRKVNCNGDQRHYTEEVAAPPPQTKEKKRKQPSRSTNGADGDDNVIRVGAEYQADILPVAAFRQKRATGTATAAAPTEPATFGYDQIWDPVQYQAAAANTSNIDTFLNGHVERECNLKTILMEHLHEAGYDVAKARAAYIRSDWNNSVEFHSDHQTKLFQRHIQTLIAGAKGMSQAASLLGCSRATVLVHFYRWKGAQRGSRSYQRVKRQRNEESSECHVCGDGGTLIVCDLCKRSYHFACHSPPVVGDMSQVDVWYCSHCQCASPARLRRRMSGGGSVVSSSTTPGSSQQTPAALSQQRALPAKALWKQSPVKRQPLAAAFRSDVTPSEATPNGLVYIAHLPVTEQGLCIRIGHHGEGSAVFFQEYTKLGDQMGPAEKANVFMSSGDVLVAVDQNPCVGLSYSKVRELMKAKPRGNKLKQFTMLHRPPPDSHAPSKPSPKKMRAQAGTPPRPSRHYRRHASAAGSHKKAASKTPPKPADSVQPQRREKGSAPKTPPSKKPSASPGQSQKVVTLPNLPPQQPTPASRQDVPHQSTVAAPAQPPQHLVPPPTLSNCKVPYLASSQPEAASLFQTTMSSPTISHVASPQQQQPSIISCTGNGDGLQHLDIRLTVGLSSSASRSQPSGDAAAMATTTPLPASPRWTLPDPGRSNDTTTTTTPLQQSARGDEAINSAALHHIWLPFQPTDMAGFFCRWGFGTVNHVISAQPAQLSNLLARDQQMELDQARDYIGTARCQMKSWLLHDK